MKRLWVLLIVLCAAFAVIALAAWLAHSAGATFPILFPSGSVAAKEAKIILATFALSGIIVIPVYVALFSFAWRYRAEGPIAHQQHAPDWDHDSLLAEFSWWLAPTLIIAALSYLAWQSSFALDPYKPLAGGAPLTVEVVALDWKWLFIYPAQGIASVNELVIPTNRPVTFELTADAPMNSFWIPALGGQIMVMPGMLTQLNLEADKAGTFNGSSANISGEGFSGMAFAVHAVSAQDFSAWAASAATATPLVYAALAAPSKNVPPAVYRADSTDLLDQVILKYMEPATTTP